MITSHRHVGCIFIILLICCIRLVQANAALEPGKLCLLKANIDYSTGTPCTDAVNAYDGRETRIHFYSCLEPFNVAVVFEQGDPTSRAVAFQTSVEYKSYQLAVREVRFDPYHYFSDEMAYDSDALHNDNGQVFYYTYASQANLFSDEWPLNNPNAVLMEIEYFNQSLWDGDVGELNFFQMVPSRVNRVVDKDGDVIGTIYNADISCGFRPTFPKPPTGVKAKPDGTDAIIVTWNKLTWIDSEDIEAPNTEFHIYRGSECHATDTVRVGIKYHIRGNKTLFRDKGVEENSTYYYYVIRKTFGNESEPSSCASATTFSAEDTVTITGALEQPDRSIPPAPGESFPSVGIAGITVELLEGDTVVGTSETDENGKFTIVFYSDTTGKTYTVRAVVTRDSGFLADAGTLVGNQGVRTLAEDITIGDNLTEISVPKLGTGPAVGDADCNGYVDVQDFLIFKGCFGANSGDGNYNLYCDFNGSGAVDVEDFLILKSNFGRGGGEPQPGLCQSE